jgi:hypothetical protein
MFRKSGAPMETDAHFSTALLTYPTARLRHLGHKGFFPNPFKFNSDPAVGRHRLHSQSYGQCFKMQNQRKFALGWEMSNKIANRARPSSAGPMWVMKHSEPPSPRRRPQRPAPELSVHRLEILTAERRQAYRPPPQGLGVIYLWKGFNISVHKHVDI